MNVMAFTVAVGAGSVAAGFLGTLTGLGGGVVLVPMLVLLFGVDIRYAIGASLVSVIATSSGTAAAYVRDGYSNVRVGMFLEIATTLGALSGAVVAARVPTSGLAIVFGSVLLYWAYLSGHRHDHSSSEGPFDRWATLLRLDSTYPTPAGERRYHVRGGARRLWPDVRRRRAIRVAGIGSVVECSCLRHRLDGVALAVRRFASV